MTTDLPDTPPPPERIVTVRFRGKPRRARHRLTKALARAGRLTTPRLPPASRALQKMWAEDLARGIDPWAELRSPPQENHQ